MQNKSPVGATTTSGILIREEIGEWAGFISGRLTVKTRDGERADFQFGRESRGEIPKIGSMVEIQHSEGILPRIHEIRLVNGEDIGLYKEASKAFGSSLFLGKPKAIAVFVIIEMILALWTIFTGLTWGRAGTAKTMLFTICGMVHIGIGYLVWNYFGQ